QSPSSLPLAGAVCSVASLGCPKNLVDSESTLGRLIALGAEFNPDASQVDFFLLNTCGFLRSARAEAEEYIAEALEQKKAGAIRFLIVAGCAVVSDGKELAEKYPQVDAWLSPYDEQNIGDVALELFGAKRAPEQAAPALPVLTPEQTAAAKFHFTPARNLEFHDESRARLTAPHVAYLKIADGCDRFCTYCTIPNIRGRYVSKPFDAIMDEASRLADSGVRELVLIAQETTFWGKDLYGAPDLKRLLAALKEKNQFDWIRVLYTYPLFWDDELISLFKMEAPGTTSVLPYIDVPLQHCNSELLKRMNRQVDKVQTEELLARFREEIPNVVLRTSLIVGFPGETDAMYQELVDFVEKQRFERAGVFEFSPEPGAPAASMPDQIAPEIKRRRFERLYAKQERISRQFARGKIGQTVDVMLDTRCVSESGELMRNVCVGRTVADAPDVDPVVYVTGRDLQPGDLIPCEIVDAQGMDLIAVPTDPEKIYVSKGERREAAEREEAESYRAQGLTPPQKKKKRNDRRGGKGKRR
ncbi:MAG: 30S ribosomal protein S12 methylthiotransferase RimO, partial [Thermoguttaceae bacterium]|nr:30S ribosomal protein S12 methylthiotransferase RimO [Thermoguttaceae bacterium]